MNFLWTRVQSREWQQQWKYSRELQYILIKIEQENSVMTCVERLDETPEMFVLRTLKDLQHIPPMYLLRYNIGTS